MATLFIIATCFVPYFMSLVLGQEQARIQCNNFNSSYQLTDAQIAKARINPATARKVNVALNFERSNWAGSSVSDDAFYDAPPASLTASPGTLLKVEETTNTTYYTLAQNLALSRILFQSETVNGTAVPASAFVLWPWQAKQYPNISGYPVVAWGHGNSGWNSECAPSHVRNLWYQFNAPYVLALQGYVVVAPDYQGLGVHTLPNGTVVPQTYANAANANDLFHAVKAAQQAWSILSKEFVIMGHSVGGGAAWAAAERQARRPVHGFLGTVAGSPLTDYSVFAAVAASVPLGGLAGIAQGMSSIFPTFKLSNWLTPLGVARLNLLDKLQGCNSVNGELLTGTEGVKPTWANTWYFPAFAAIASSGGKAISKPMLVLQGTADTTVPAVLNSLVVNETCTAYPNSQLTYALFDGSDHVPTLNAAQQVWLKFIDDLFNGVDVDTGCQTNTYEPLRAITAYQAEPNYYLEWVQYPYEVA